MTDLESARLNIKFAKDMIISSVKRDRSLAKGVIKELWLETDREDIVNLIDLLREVDREMGV